MIHQFFMAIHCPSVGTRLIASVGWGGAIRSPLRILLLSCPNMLMGCFRRVIELPSLPMALKRVKEAKCLCLHKVNTVKHNRLLLTHAREKNYTTSAKNYTTWRKIGHF